MFALFFDLLLLHHLGTALHTWPLTNYKVNYTRMDHGHKCKTIKFLGRKQRRKAMEPRARQRVLRQKGRPQFIKEKSGKLEVIKIKKLLLC